MRQWQYHDRNRITWKYDAVLKQYKKSETIFEKDHLATQYYQIISGPWNNNFNDEGREFIQEFFYANHSFGEPPYFWTESFANTEATEDSELLCISKHNFLKLITENATISIKIIQILFSVCIIKRLWRQRFRLKILIINDLNLIIDCIS
jgi:CRP-like cAMP-binding protein